MTFDITAHLLLGDSVTCSSAWSNTKAQPSCMGEGDRQLEWCGAREILEATPVVSVVSELLLLCTSNCGQQHGRASIWGKIHLVCVCSFSHVQASYPLVNER